MRTIQLRHTGILLLTILQFAFAGAARGQNISVTPQLITVSKSRGGDDQRCCGRHAFKQSNWHALDFEHSNYRSIFTGK